LIVSSLHFCNVSIRRAILLNMALQPKAVLKPFRKFLKGFSQFPAPEDVHALRIQARHLEAVVHALQLENQAAGSGLLKALKPLRKQAGQVRDLDVLIGFSSSLQHEADDQSLVNLLEELSVRRKKAAQKLSETVSAREQKTSKHLKRCLKLVEDETGLPDANAPDGRQVSIKPMARALQLQAELAEWPPFTAKNLHPYRLKVKELRYVLDLGESTESQFRAALSEVKEQIGAWHDWSQLARISRKSLRNGSGPKLLKQIRARASQEFDKALDLANALQVRYFSGPAVSVARKKAPVLAISASAIKDTSRLAG
jgi:CHAD domain-containing protein